MSSTKVYCLMSYYIERKFSNFFLNFRSYESDEKKAKKLEKTWHGPLITSKSPHQFSFFMMSATVSKVLNIFSKSFFNALLLEI